MKKPLNRRLTNLTLVFFTILNFSAYGKSTTTGFLTANVTESTISSPTEGVISSAFISEETMKNDLLQLLANFMTYVKNDYADCAAPNTIGEACGCFKGENTMGNDEKGVRPNADLSMICAFLYKYGQGKVTLPNGVTWSDVKGMALKSLVFAYSTHKANKLKVCSGNNYWGSTAATDYTWESSLWAMSVAYSAFFQYDNLTDAQKTYVYNLIKAESNYELTRNIPTGYSGDTKAEENGWETNILACALGLYPNDDLAEQWYNRLRQFAINCYSQANDAKDTTVIDPSYDSKTVADLYLGKNLYDDYTLQNHSYFHTSYQNVVMQELGESLLAMKLFQDSVYGRENWKTNALMHNNQKVMDNVLNYLALADGELAMPNGNDWSLFLYDQITSYATMACFARDPNALMLENLAYQNIKARQTTTTDGSWLLRPDVGARRMGVEAHRVMMTWLMHEAASTATMSPTAWNDFSKKHESAVLWTTQNIVRAATPERFSCFSWSSGLSSYTGYFTQNLPDKNKIIVPYKANNTGNIVGWYIVNGQTINASPVTSGIYTLKGNSYTMNGILNTNGNTLTNNFALYSTPGNALIYLDYVKANGSLSITGERGGLLAVSTDDFTKQKRDLYYEGGYLQTNGSTMSTFTSSWINIDNQIGVLTPGSTSMGFGDRAVNNSIYTAKLYPLYNATTRSVNSGDLVGRRQVVYYSNVTAEQTKTMTAQTVSLKDLLPSGWNGIIVTDPDSIRFALVSNFAGTTNAEVSGLAFAEGAPVFSSRTMVKDGQSTVHFTLNTAHSQGDVLRVFVTSGNITACQATDSISVYLTNTQVTATSVGLTILTSSTAVKGTVSVPAASRILVRVINGTLVTSFAPEEAAPDNDITSLILKNAGFDEAPITYNVSGTLNNNAVNKWNDAGYSSAYSYNVTGWNNASIVNDNASFTATFALGSIAKFNGTTPPATDVSGKSSGNVLGVSSGWGTGNAVQFYQEVKLPAGKYLLKYDVYNANTSSTSIIRNLCGFFAPDASAKETVINVFDGNLNFPSSTWTTDSVTLSSAEPLDILISIGASCSSASSNAGAKLFFDNVRLLTDQTTETVQNYLNNLTGIISPVAGKNADEKVSVYTIDGKLLSNHYSKKESLRSLYGNRKKGLYLVGSEKVLVH